MGYGGSSDNLGARYIRTCAEAFHQIAMRAGVRGGYIQYPGRYTVPRGLSHSAQLSYKLEGLFLDYRSE